MQAHITELKSFGPGPSRNFRHITNDLATEVKLPFCSVLLNVRTINKTYRVSFLNSTFREG